MRQCIIICFLILFCNLSAQKNNPYQYVNPKPGSMLVSRETNIIVRYSGNIDRTSLSGSRIRVEGSESGEHAGEFILTDDDKTMVFNPSVPFTVDEEVRVVLADGIKTQAGAELSEFSFTFSIASAGIIQLSYPVKLEGVSSGETESYLPAPPIRIDSVNDPSPGYIFMATWDRNVPAHNIKTVFIWKISFIIGHYFGEIKHKDYLPELYESGLK
jgi:hypothetical protein